MKIYIGHSKKLDFMKELYQPLRESRLNSEHELILPHEIHQEASDFVTRDIIKTCDLMIAEVSLPAIGLGIELGWANAYGCPIICIYRKGVQTAGSLKVVCENFIEYETSDELIDKLEAVLAKQLH